MLFAWTDDKITEENGSEYFFQKNTSAPEFFCPFISSDRFAYFWNARVSMPDSLILITETMSAYLNICNIYSSRTCLVCTMSLLGLLAYS